MTLPRIMVAPNGASRRKADHPSVPETVAELVETAIACEKAGADGIHAHVRDDMGQHVLDAGLYREFLTEMAARLPGFYVQITTEAVGRYSPKEQRRLVWDVAPQAASVALREMMSDPDKAAIRRFYFDCYEAGIEVQHILYSEQDVDWLADLIAEGTVPKQGLTVLHVLGRYTPGQISTVADLAPFLARQQSREVIVDWAVCAFGQAETACLREAARLGGKVRVGFENNLLNPDGAVASDNAERVREVMAALAS